ncbi:putative amidohydrolase [Cavenderia fasciculata]|uniref:Amidohydrolase n=1 Tax=Cavenderia fasciculata TaxID=261658 RepID=F4PHN5_CACFS|nr:putative amidohydrolase [Cavenderia fasciculata]EGG25219.1 putative amidohydrolase [Cavenderia fasciculata]|eukprot:XP_004363070.1 putative amidohydrolase [Cavenderia fasciculata]
MEEVDLIIGAKYIIPIVPSRTYLVDHVIVVKDKKIVDIVKKSQVDEKYKAKEVVQLGGGARAGDSDLDEYILTAGFFNMHCHSAMTLLRGYADDVSLLDWLTKFIWPAEAKWVGEEFVKLGTELACLEMIKTGTTYANEMYYYPEIAAEVMENSGMRATVSVPIIKFPTIYANNEAEYLEKGEKFIEQYKSNEMIRPALGPHAVYTITDEAYLRVKELSEKHNLVIHTHLHETHVEVADEEKLNGKRPLARLDGLGVLSERLIAVHMTQLTKEECQLVADNKVNVVHCPESNLKLGVAGICPVHQLEKCGVNVCIGTDSAASNDDLDMLSEMRCAALVDKLCYNMTLKSELEPNPQSSGVTPSHRMLSMATINGAKALGVDKELGSIEIGKFADIVAIKVTSPPIYDAISHLVYVGTNRVTDVWVGGKNLLKNTVLQTMNEDEIRKKVIEFSKKIKDIRPTTGTIVIQ